MNVREEIRQLELRLRSNVWQGSVLTIFKFDKQAANNAKLVHMGC